MYKLNDLPERNKISFYTVFFYEMLFLCLYFLGTCFVKLKKNSTFYSEKIINIWYENFSERIFIYT